MIASTNGLLVALALAIPLAFAFGSLLSTRRGFPVAPGYAAFGASLLLTGVACASPAARLRAHATWGLLAIDAVTCAMVLLVTFIGVVVLRYARTYLDGDPGRSGFARSLLAALTAISVLVLSDSLLLTAAAWTATSLAIHRLLIFYPERPQAVIAARKKFLLSRLADLLIVGTLALIASSAGTLQIHEVNTWLRTEEATRWEIDLGAILLVLAVALKSAQVPFHGWLIQVMEAPTPVSALLHAGVVNIGGFVLIRVAPLVERVPAAQTLLVAIGTFTAVVAALVATTRVSVKVALAWSTCAQMGFMLVECGLGAWQLALLHIVAHSLYKASSFLRSGSVVELWRARNLAPAKREPTSFVRLVLVAVLGAAVTTGGLSAARAMGLAVGPWAALLTTVGLTAALLPTLARASEFGARHLLSTSLASVGLTAFFAGVHALSELVWTVEGSSTAPTAAWVVAASGFAALFVTQIMLLHRPNGLLARELHPLLFGGLYLDEIFTRLALRVWPRSRSTTRRSFATYAPTLEAR